MDTHKNTIHKKQNKQKITMKYIHINGVGIVLFACVAFGSASAQTYRDTDADSLIEVSYIEQLDSMRYNLTGTGTCVSATGSVVPCKGYELTRSLDFKSSSSYLSDSINPSYNIFGECPNECGWRPIGTASVSNPNVLIQAYPFNTTFEGNGHTIDNVYIYKLSNSYHHGIGFFGRTGNNSNIRNIGIRNINVEGTYSIGGLVGIHEGGTISNSYATGSLTGHLYIGGLVGASYGVGTISNSYATVFLVGSSQWVIGSPAYIGGLVGYNNATIIQSYATGDVSGISYIGGLVGYNSTGVIIQSYATGDVSGTINIGGLVGNNSSVISQSYATGDVSGTSDIGGLVGNNYGTIRHGYWNKNTHLLGIGYSHSIGKLSNIRGLTLSALINPTGNTTDSIRELGPGFIYCQGSLPKIHRGARVTINGVSFTQTVPSSTNIGATSMVANVIQGTDTTRATLAVITRNRTVHFTANVIGTTSIINNHTITNIQNGVKQQDSISFTTSVSTKTFGDVPFTLQARSYGCLPVLYSPSSTLVSISKDTVRIMGVGTVRITAYSENDTVSMASANQILTIHKAAQSISFGTLIHRTFGTASFTISASASSSLAVVFSASNTLISINNNTVSIQGAGTVQIIAHQTGNNNYLKDSVIQTLVIHKAAQSISFGTLIHRTFGTAAFTISASASSSLAVVFSASNTLVSINNNTVSIQGAGTVQIIAHQTGNNNYLKDSAIQTLVIHKTAQSISFGTLIHRTFGTAPFVLEATSSESLPVLFSASNTLISINNNTASIRGAGTVIITAYNDTSNFVATNHISLMLTIYKAAQSISFGTLIHRTFGTAPFTITASASSSLAVVFSASNTLVSINTDTVTINGTGTVQITAHQTGNNNYLKDSAIQTLVIHKAAQSISFVTLIHRTFGTAPFTITASASSSMTVVFSASNTLVSINTDTVTINGTGTVQITAHQTGNNNYLKDSAIQTLVIHKAAQSISFVTLIHRTFGTAPFTITASASSSMTVVFSASNTLISINNNTVSIQGAGTVQITAHQTGNNNYLKDSAIQTLVIHKAAQSISFGTLIHRTFGTAPFTITASASSSMTVVFSASNTLISINNNTVSIQGAGTVQIIAHQTGNNNYLKDSAIQTFTIHKAYQSISFGTLIHRTFGDAPFILDATSSESLPVLFSASNTLVSINTDIVSINGAGTVSITAYSENDTLFGFTNQTLIINKANQSISFNRLENRTFGDAPFILDATSSESLPVLFSASNTLISINNNTVSINGAGTVSITAYSENDTLFGFTNQTLIINKANQSISFETLANRTFGDTPFILEAMSSESLPVLFSASNTLISINNNTVSINGAGTVSITAYQIGNNNFLNADTVVQILTINKGNQSISFETLANRTFGDAPFILEATSSAGLPVLFSASNTLVSINNNTVTINGVGLVSIDAYNTGNSDYLEASAPQILTIKAPTTKTTSILTFSTLPTLSIGQRYTLIATSNSPVPIIFSSANTNIISISGNTATAKAIGNVVITASQQANAQFNLAITRQTVTVISPNTVPNPIASTETSNASIRIFPNPANDYITIQTDTRISSVKIFDITGVNYELGIMNYKLGFRMDLKVLPKGEYIIIVYGEKGEVLKAEKVIKE